MYLKILQAIWKYYTIYIRGLTKCARVWIATANPWASCLQILRINSPYFPGFCVECCFRIMMVMFQLCLWIFPVYVCVNMHVCMHIHVEAREQSRTLPSRTLTASFVTGSSICFHLFDGWERVFVLQGEYRGHRTAFSGVFLVLPCKFWGSNPGSQAL